MRSGRCKECRRGIIGVILVVIFAFLCALGMAAIMVMKTIRVHESGHNRVLIETPAGTVNIRSGRKLDPEAAGIPVYPGARLADHDNRGGAMFEWTSSDGSTEKSASVAGAEYLTPDSPEQVFQFYRRKLDHWIFVEDRNNEYKFEHTEGSWNRFVVIRARNDGTHIGVASIGSLAGN